MRLFQIVVNILHTLCKNIQYIYIYVKYNILLKKNNKKFIIFLDKEQIITVVLCKVLFFKT